MGGNNTDLATYDCDEITMLNQTASPLLRLPLELRNNINEFVFSTATLWLRVSCSHGVRHTQEKPSRCLCLRNAGHGLTQTCRQLRREAACDGPQHLTTLVLPLYVELSVLIHILGRRKCESVQKIEVHDKMARRLRGLMFGVYLGHRVNLWKDGELAGKVFCSLRSVTVEGVWKKNVQKTRTAIRACFGREDLVLKFC
ncbi:uncharacterized protein EKO05_0007163 [Ascochyta rabiei]|uniref:uncharacterized protein n=1 Tax=Didymella rabiei TaxID=5454 RepID=UPI002209C7BE|nr:uncharacterized protein EKO05_0007163 [Ascochyta rabiei]UPX16777.1 hypothetical protein EKO05_0007163 [Ascochyta rabiei]